ncbi:extensin-2-like [Penaeus chinensis]|uniref:extensin-2-like n=1 Tax=Penaeus chinensis TaxID=139456 RepID=UPI001FB70C7E|nr:extensin-2-like [Penaeus chinensis]
MALLQVQQTLYCPLFRRKSVLIQENGENDAKQKNGKKRSFGCVRVAFVAFLASSRAASDLKPRPPRAHFRFTSLFHGGDGRDGRDSSSAHESSLRRPHDVIPFLDLSPLRPPPAHLAAPPPSPHDGMPHLDLRPPPLPTHPEPSPHSPHADVAHRHPALHPDSPLHSLHGDLTHPGPPPHSLHDLTHPGPPPHSLHDLTHPDLPPHSLHGDLTHPDLPPHSLHGALTHPDPPPHSLHDPTHPDPPPRPPSARTTRHYAASEYESVNKKPYEFEYGVKDAYHGTSYSRQEESDGHDTKGQYQVKLPDGRIQTVIYRAGVDGFHAEVVYEGEPHYPKEKPLKGSTPLAHSLSPVHSATAKPPHTVSKLVYTSPKPVYTTPKPVYTTPNSVFSNTGKPVHTLPKISFTTFKPASFTPVHSTPHHTKPKSVHAPKPVLSTPKPVHVTPKPFHSTSKPVRTTLKSIHVTPKPAHGTLKPFITTPKPVHSTFKPALTTPKPISGTFESFFTTPKPVHSTFKPIHTTAKPVHSTLKSVLTSPKPIHSTFKPAVTTPKPVHTTPHVTAKPIHTTLYTLARPVKTTSKPFLGQITSKPQHATSDSQLTTPKPLHFSTLGPDFHSTPLSLFTKSPEQFYSISPDSGLPQEPVPVYIVTGKPLSTTLKPAYHVSPESIYNTAHQELFRITPKPSQATTQKPGFQNTPKSVHNVSPKPTHHTSPRPLHVSKPNIVTEHPFPTTPTALSLGKVPLSQNKEPVHPTKGLVSHEKDLVHHNVEPVHHNLQSVTHPKEPLHHDKNPIFHEKHPSIHQTTSLPPLTDKPFTPSLPPTLSPPPLPNLHTSSVPHQNTKAEHAPNLAIQAKPHLTLTSTTTIRPPQLPLSVTFPTQLPDIGPLPNPKPILVPHAEASPEQPLHPRPTRPHNGHAPGLHLHSTSKPPVSSIPTRPTIIPGGVSISQSLPHPSRPHNGHGLIPVSQSLPSRPPRPHNGDRLIPLSPPFPNQPVKTRPTVSHKVQEHNLPHSLSDLPPETLPPRPHEEKDRLPFFHSLPDRPLRPHDKHPHVPLAHSSLDLPKRDPTRIRDTQSPFRLPLEPQSPIPEGEHIQFTSSPKPTLSPPPSILPTDEIHSLLEGPLSTLVTHDPFSIHVQSGTDSHPFVTEPAVTDDLHLGLKFKEPLFRSDKPLLATSRRRLESREELADSGRSDAQSR